MQESDRIAEADPAAVRAVDVAGQGAAVQIDTRLPERLLEVDPADVRAVSHAEKLAAAGIVDTPIIAADVRIGITVNRAVADAEADPTDVGRIDVPAAIELADDRAVRAAIGAGIDPTDIRAIGIRVVRVDGRSRVGSGDDEESWNQIPNCFHDLTILV